ncbi:zinc finger protein Dzip1 [Colias croceus]|uniref:zinc finger protein Dzip1 n=1 Tax=Colias crocea TaxID=72248 RepID=UPI001E27C955|nr:zinc finger protein Dzip1 [Colias croceus]
MACKASFELYHNFPKLAEEAGFAFNTHRPRVHIEWNKIRLLDIESLIRERKFVLIEQHLNDILDCVLESEFDVRILDEGVVKIFRLAQLAVEYQQFCRHYLDRSVYVLREEVTSLAQELDTNKRSLREKEEDIRRLKRKSKHVIRTPLPYGNENIATMILNTLKNQSDIFHSAPHLDTLQHNKCKFCDKVFLNQLYLKSHISRRHPNITEIPEKDVPSEENLTQINSNENSKLLNEIEDLKIKLKEMENLIAEKHKFKDNEEVVKSNSFDGKKQDPPVKEMKDAEVLTQDPELETVKMEQWKTQEFDKYNQELNLLRTQILQIIDANKENKNSNQIENDNKLIEKLQATIKQQGAELLSLKQELINSKSLKENMEAERKKEIEAQISEWAKKVEMQSTECRSLLQKLNEMAKDVQEYKAIANEERDKAEQLQQLLNQQRKIVKQDKKVEEIKPVCIDKNKNVQIKKDNLDKGYPTADRMTLEKLQKKAQELLSLEQSSTSDQSTVSEESNDIVEQKTNMIVGTKKKEVLNFNSFDKHREYKFLSNKNIQLVDKQQPQKATTGFVKKKGNKKVKSSSKKLQNGPVTLPVSPVKVVRAKITEEVNQRLVQLGVDPLKNRLPKSTFQKQRHLLQKLQEVKVKKYPSREKIYHSIQAHLDANTISTVRHVQKNETIDVSPSKASKLFSLTSVLSNVKTKALSLVKPTEKFKKNDANSHYKNAMLDKSPTSGRSSIINSKEVTPTPSPHRSSQDKVTKMRRAKKDMSSKKYLQNQTESSNESESEINNGATKLYDRALESIDDLVKSPLRKPNDSNFKRISKDFDTSYNIKSFESKNSKITQNIHFKVSRDNSSDDIESLVDTTPRKAFSEENISPKQTKGVLKNASSTSSLNKKKVLFDMDAIQMKSVSATPSQSLAEKSDGNENYSLGIINLDTEEWDPSSIENEPPKKSTIQVTARTSPKIAELKQAIESQMSRRIQTPSTALAGSVNLLPTPMVRTSLGGSNTSLGSSILDESENQIAINNQRQPILVKQNINIKKHENDDSEIDFSELLADDKSDNKF